MVKKNYLVRLCLILCFVSFDTSAIATFTPLGDSNSFPESLNLTSLTVALYRLRGRTRDLVPRVSVSFLKKFAFSGDDIARRIRFDPGFRPPKTLYGLGVFIYDKIQEGKLKQEFTISDIQDLTGRSYITVFYKLNFLTEIGVLKKEEGKLLPRQGKEPNKYQLKNPFEQRENLELLAAVAELHRGRGEGFSEELVETIKAKIETILAARQNLEIRLSPELEAQAEGLKIKFLIAIGYPGMIELFKSFSSVGLTIGENLDISYDPLHNALTLFFPQEAITGLFSQKPWELFLKYSSDSLRKKLLFTVLAEDSGVTPDLLDVFRTLNISASFEPAKFFANTQKFINFLVALMRHGNVLTNYSSEFFSYFESDFANTQSYPPQYGLTFLEKIVAQRSKSALTPFYQDLISTDRSLVGTFLDKIEQLSAEERAVLILRWLLEYNPKDIGQVLFDSGVETTILTEERVRQIEIRAFEKLRHPGRTGSLIPNVERIEQIFEEVYNNIVFP